MTDSILTVIVREKQTLFNGSAKVLLPPMKRKI